MEIFRIAGIALISTFAYLMLKDTRPDAAVLTAAAGGVVILLLAADYLSESILAITGLVNTIGLDSQVMSTVLKVIGVGYVTEFSSSLCEDAGSKSLAEKVRFFGKILILFLSLPILTAIIEIIAAVIQ